MRRLALSLILALCISSAGAQTITNVPPRERLTAAKTYTVAVATGNDSNTCILLANACQTIQGAVNKALNNLDTAGNTVNINVLQASGTNTASVTVNGPLYGGGTLVITGSIAGTLLTVTGANAITATNGAVVQIKNLTISTVTSGIAISAQQGAYVTLGTGMVFGGVVGSSQLDARTFGTISAGNAYTISGGGVSHLHGDAQGFITVDNIVITCTGSPAFSSYFAGAGSAYIEAIGTTFSGCGTVTGPRFTVNRNGSIRTNTSDPNFFPGDSIGTVVSSGSFDDITLQTRNITTGSADTATTADYVILWLSASGLAKAQTLPACTSTGPWHPIVVIDDFGDAGTQNITLTASASTFDGAASKVINTNRGGVTVKCDGSTNYATVH